MTPERWRQVTAIFHAARGREPATRAAFLDHACAGDASLRSEVDSLLAGHEDASRVGTSAVSSEALPQLSPGTAFGQYRIEGLVGSGGMGQVYRATDPRLHRTVAIKVLMPTLVPDGETDARFEREARLLASLNHPNIAAIHGLETAGTVQGLVLEFVEGQTLAARLSKGRVPVPEALTIARQIALALEAAHEKGIVHRDLKPANVKITPSGVVKVLDFGIARIAADGQMPAATAMGATGTGLILGTPAYMSPEQARGLAIDKRTDVWAFGCVLYEMLTGRGAFAADTASDSVARVLEREPDWAKLPPDVPPSIVRLLKRCLQKDVGNRLRDIGDAGIEIADALTPGRPDIALHDVPAVSRRVVAGIAAAIVAVLALAAFGVWRMTRTSETSSSAPAAVEFGVMFPGNLLPSFGVAVSPDGKYIAAGVFGVAGQIWLHSLGTNETRPLPGTEGGQMPFWSPDGSTVGYAVRDQLWTVAVAGGSPILLGRIGPGYRGATWHSNGTILVASQGKILRMPAGGTPVDVPLGSVSGPPAAPGFLPDGRHFVFTAWKRFGGDVFLASIDSGRPTKLLESDSPAGFAAPDRLLFVRGASLFTQRLDLSVLTLTGTPELVDSGIVPSHLFERQQMTISASTSGVLAYPAPRGGSAGQLRWFDRAGKAGESIESPPDAEYINPAISPDGTMVAANRVDPQTGRWDIWYVDTRHGGPSKLTTNPADDFDPVWSPDSKEIVFASRRGERLGLYRQAIAGGRGAELLLEFDNSDLVPTDWSRDPQYILYQRAVLRSWAIWALPLFGDRKPIPLVDAEFAPYAPHLSPDGRWLAYNSFESGTAEVFVRRFLSDGPKKQISHGGGVHPRWTRDGKELVYWSPPGGIYSHTMSMTSSGITVGPRQTLLDRPVLSLIDGRTHYDITRDGTRLLVRQPAGPTGPGIKVILNWTSKLKK
ncbi:MAG: protein kinase domain-containing protein [Acidobacteriota bacterium]